MGEFYFWAWIVAVDRGNKKKSVGDYDIVLWEAKKEELKRVGLKEVDMLWSKNTLRKILFKEVSMKWESQEARDERGGDYEYMCARQEACLFLFNLFRVC